MSNYTNVAYTEDMNTTWFKMVSNIPEKSRVLDIGCSSGNFGKVLTKQKECEVIGVDLDAEDVKRAKKVLKAAYVMNIERDNFSKLGKFDRVIFADVLEHLVDPVASLQKVKKLLKPGGQVLFSIPNMAHMGTRLMLLTGKFGYGETGLLDKTHLHFYDEAEVRRIFNDAGFSLETLDWTEYYIPQKEVTARLADVGLKPTKQFYESAKEISAVALQYVGAASPTQQKTKQIDLPRMSPWVDKTDEYIRAYERRADEKVAAIQAELDALRHSKPGQHRVKNWKAANPLKGIKRLKRDKR